MEKRLYINLCYDSIISVSVNTENGLDITDSVITDCDFTDFKGLTLENVKSTWNYKHGRMEGIKLPEEIQKALDAEKEQR